MSRVKVTNIADASQHAIRIFLLYFAHGENLFDDFDKTYTRDELKKIYLTEGDELDFEDGIVNKLFNDTDIAMVINNIAYQSLNLLHKTEDMFISEELVRYLRVDYGDTWDIYTEFDGNTYHVASVDEDYLSENDNANDLKYNLDFNKEEVIRQFQVVDKVKRGETFNTNVYEG